MLNLCYDKLPAGGAVLLAIYECEPELNESAERFLGAQRSIMAWDTALRESNAQTGQ